MFVFFLELAIPKEKTVMRIVHYRNHRTVSQDRAKSCPTVLPIARNELVSHDVDQKLFQTADDMPMRLRSASPQPIHNDDEDGGSKTSFNFDDLTANSNGSRSDFLQSFLQFAKNRFAEKSRSRATNFGVVNTAPSDVNNHVTNHRMKLLHEEKDDIARSGQLDGVCDGKLYSFTNNCTNLDFSCQLDGTNDNEQDQPSNILVQCTHCMTFVEHFDRHECFQTANRIVNKMDVAGKPRGAGEMSSNGENFDMVNENGKIVDNLSEAVKSERSQVILIKNKINADVKNVHINIDQASIDGLCSSNNSNLISPAKAPPASYNLKKMLSAMQSGESRSSLTSVCNGASTRKEMEEKVLATQTIEMPYKQALTGMISKQPLAGMISPQKNTQLGVTLQVPSPEKTPQVVVQTSSPQSSCQKVPCRIAPAQPTIVASQQSILLSPHQTILSSQVCVQQQTPVLQPILVASSPLLSAAINSQRMPGSGLLLGSSASVQDTKLQYVGTFMLPTASLTPVTQVTFLPGPMLTQSAVPVLTPNIVFSQATVNACNDVSPNMQVMLTNGLRVGGILNLQQASHAGEYQLATNNILTISSPARVNSTSFGLSSSSVRTVQMTAATVKSSAPEISSYVPIYSKNNEMESDIEELPIMNKVVNTTPNKSNYVKTIIDDLSLKHNKEIVARPYVFHGEGLHVVNQPTMPAVESHELTTRKDSCTALHQQSYSKLSANSSKQSNLLDKYRGNVGCMSSQHNQGAMSSGVLSQNVSTSSTLHEFVRFALDQPDKQPQLYSSKQAKSSELIRSNIPSNVQNKQTASDSTLANKWIPKTVALAAASSPAHTKQFVTRKRPAESSAVEFSPYSKTARIEDTYNNEIKASCSSLPKTESIGRRPSNLRQAPHAKLHPDFAMGKLFLSCKNCEYKS